MSDIGYRLKVIYWKIRSLLQIFLVCIYAANKAKKISDKRYTAQLYEILVLRFSRGKLGPDEYYYYGLHDDERYSLSDKKQFLGQRVVKKINDRLNHKEWRAVANDKLVLYSILQRVGLSSPEIYAVTGPRPGSSAIYLPCPLRIY